MRPLLPIDWATLWYEQVTAEHAQYERLCDPAYHPGSDWWAGLAQQFHDRSRRAPQPDSFLQQVLPHVQPGTTVLDVGAGTGRYALPLARLGAHVTAIEPSAAMLGYLRDDADAEGLNIHMHQTSWQAAEVAPADLVICAHVLYPIADAAAFLRKLHTRRLHRCWLLLGYEPPSGWMRPFWRAFYGEERLPLPGAVHALALLHQLGIDAQLTPITPTGSVRFNTLDEAIIDIRRRLSLAPERFDDRRLREVLEQQLESLPGGGYTARTPPHMAVLAW